MSVSMFFVGVVLAAGTGISAQELQQPASVVAVKEKKICRAVPTTGSIMSKRICLTRTEWAQLNDENERHADMMKASRNRSIDTRAFGELDE